MTTENKAIDDLLLAKAKELNLYVDFSDKTYDGDKEAPMDRIGLLEYLLHLISTTAQQLAPQSNILSGHQLLPQGELTNKVEVQQQLAPSWVKAEIKPKQLLRSYYCKVWSDHFKKEYRKQVLITLDGQWQTDYKVLEWLNEQPAERAAQTDGDWKKKDFLSVLEENYEASKLGAEKYHDSSLNKIQYEAIRQEYKDIIAIYKSWRAAQTDVATDDDWISEKPKTFKDDCILLTASWYKDHCDITAFEMIFSDGENDQGEPAYYWGIFQDGDEWGDYEDLHAALYKIVPLPKPPKQ